MRFFLLVVLFYMTAKVQGQTVLDWSDLSNGIVLEPPAPATIFPGFQEATFSSKMADMEGKIVIITGYLLILDGKQATYLLSKNPMASCFFCGNGGPETVLDLKFSEKPSFKMDDLLSVEGTLYLNEDNPDACYYRIENADAISFN